MSPLVTHVFSPLSTHSSPSRTACARMLTLSEPLTIEPLGIAVPRDDRQFHGLIENYVDALEGTGVLAALRKAWLEDGSWIAQLP